MSEEILEGQESEEQSVEETEESSDVQIQAEAKTKASVKKEEEDSEEEDEEEVEEAVKEEDEEEGDSEEEEEEPAEESFEIPKTKNQMLKNIYDQVNKMKKSDLSGKYESILKATQKVVKEEEEVNEEAETTKIQAVSPQEIDPPNVQDDVEALVSGEEGLSEEFKKKASTIFEAAVHAKVVDEVN